MGSEALEIDQGIPLIPILISHHNDLCDLVVKLTLLENEETQSTYLGNKRVKFLALFWCRIVTTAVGFFFFLFSVMIVSLMLTRGKRMFGSL